MRGVIGSVAAMGAAVALVAVAPAAAAPLQMSVAKVSPKNGGGEPSIAAGPEGNLYVSYPGADGPYFYRSTDGGQSWVAGPLVQSNSGDTTVNVDSSGAVYESNLDTNALQGQVFKSFDFGNTFPQQGVGFTHTSSTGATSQPFAVDRQWTDAWIPPGKTTNDARVYISYHDFGPSQVWVNTSTDGGRTFGPPVDVVQSPAAQQATFCNSVPGGTKVVQSGPHAGRVYVAWLAANVATSAATGCNYTMLDTFNSVWIAYSDDGGQTWTDQEVFDGGFGHDASVLFADLTLDNQGNPYVFFGDNLPPSNEWDMYVEASFDGGRTFNGKSDGTGAPYKVNSDTGTHFFPAIAVGDPGKVDVAYIATPGKIATEPTGKAAPGGGAGDSWYLYVAQSLDFRTGHPTWAATKVTPDPIHVGDVCNLGIFCVDPNSNRDLLDFIDATVDGKGLLHASFTQDITDSGGNAVPARNGIFVANEVGGSTVGAGPSTGRPPAATSGPRLALSVRPRSTTTGCRVFRFHTTRRSNRRPVRGATVSFHGHRATSDAHGNASIRTCIRSAGRFGARATKRGYRPASARVTVRSRIVPRFTG